MSSRKPPNRVVLTQLYCDKVKPGEEATNSWDLKAPGLCWRLQPSGHSSFFFVYARHGKPCWFFIGTGVPLGDARRIALKLRVAVAEGRDPLAERKAERNDVTFGRLADDYLEQHAKKRNKSWKQARSLVERFALPKWKTVPAKSISRADVRNLISKIRSPSVANLVLASISAVCAWGVRQEILAVNPSIGIEKNPIQSRERILADAEVPLFWQAFEFFPALKLVLLTGQRPGEVMHMRQEHVVGNLWHLPGAANAKSKWPGTKNGRSHKVWLSGPAGDAFQEFIELDTRPNVIQAMRRICRHLNIENRVTPHDLRRSFATAVTRLGHPRTAMDRILNHVDHSVGSVYDRNDYADLDKKIMEDVANFFLALCD